LTICTQKLTLYSFFLIPETKGVPLERMDELFEIKPAFKAHGILVQQMKDHEDENVVIRDEKLRADEHTESMA
jgi:hypothetical protein